MAIARKTGCDGPVPARAHLKAATQRVHDALDHHLSRTVFADRAGYAAFVADLLAIHADLVDRLASAGECDLAALQDDLHRLREDAEGLGVSPTALPARRVTIDLGTRAERLGCRYVLEGARLGGLVISRRAVATLGIDPATETGFFNRPTEEIGRRWQQFCAELEQYCRDPATIEAACRSACQTFEYFRSHLLREDTG
jgi:heme oxygenase